MNPNDQEKTTFMIDKEIYCYKVMLSGLKNTRSAYQMLVNKMFEEQLGDTMEVYINDMLVKSKLAKDHVLHLQKPVEILRCYNMKLKPSKCSFGIAASKFLGYVVTQCGLEANSD